MRFYRSRSAGVFACAVTLVASACVPAVAGADEYATGFESPAFAPGDIGGQSGWKKVNANFDVEVAAAPGGLGLGGQSLRASNEVTAPSVTNQTFSPSLVNEAGERDALSEGRSGGVRQPRWEASMSFAAFEDALQSGLAVNVAPDRGDGQRMGNVRIEDSAQGLKVTSSAVVDNGPGQTAGFSDTLIASGLDRAVPHTLAFLIDFVDGPANDVLNVYVDGALVHTAGTWEQYYRNDPEQAIAGNDVPTTDALIVALRGTAAPGLAGKGMFIDNVSIRSSTPTVTPPVPPAPPATPPAAPPAPPLAGTPGVDRITGSPGNDRIDGGAGNDRLFGADGNDTLLGGTGNDRVAGGAGNDRIDGGTGNDLVFAGTGNDRVAGGTGNDRMFGDTGNDRLSGGSGKDNFSGGTGNDVLDGGSGNDLLSGNGGNDTVRAGAGNDRIKVADGRRDTVSCGTGRDVVRADRGDRVANDCETVKRG